MKTIIEEIESRIAEHKEYVAGYDLLINSGNVNDCLKEIARRFRGRSESVIEELEGLKKAITFDAIATNTDALNAAIEQIKAANFTPNHIAYFDEASGEWKEKTLKPNTDGE